MKQTRLLSILAAVAFAASATGCLKPPRTMPEASVIGFDGTTAVPPDCASLTRSSLLTDGGFRRPGMQWGCATYTNLAAQIARPEDIVNPQTLGPADAAVAASAVHRYETGRVIELDKTTSRSSQ